MKLEDARAAFYEASATLSDNTRKLLFAGIAIVWIFKSGDRSSAGIGFSRSLILPLAAFVAGLLLDMLQYLYKTIAWWYFYKSKHRKKFADDAQVAAPNMINVITFAFFYLKIGACAWGYYYVIRYIWAALNLIHGD